MALATGGPAVNTVALALLAQAAGHCVSIMTTDFSTPAQAREPQGGATVADFPLGAADLEISIYPIRRPYRLAFSPELGKALMDNVDHFDVIHIHSVNLYPQYAAWRAATKHKVPYVVSPRGALDPWIRGRGKLRRQINDFLWQRKMLNEAAALHLTTEDERWLIAPMNVRAPHIVIPNGVNVGAFARGAEPSKFRQQWLNGFDGPLILNHGRLTEKKGLDILVVALGLMQHRVSAQLALIGSDDEGVGKRLLELAVKLGVERRISIVPSLSGDDLLNAIAAADVWALPSHTENFGLAVVEAMTAGRPVVTSTHVNIAPDAASAQALMMVPNTPESVAEAITLLLADPDKRMMLSTNATKYVWKYDWSVVGQQYVDLYSSLLGDRKA